MKNTASIFTNTYIYFFIWVNIPPVTDNVPLSERPVLSKIPVNI